MIYENRSDGLLTLLGKQTMTFNETKKFCASIPGHRMAMTKKKTQIEVLKNLQNRAGIGEYQKGGGIRSDKSVHGNWGWIQEQGNDPKK
ncbi:hypothetical protein Pcinc_019467 [Petrolisthes cinctipes]|uniref:Uncharacterized protein n=1 Tax=Petrolisthes cinctipes TaxID=88211 RepID=A0AAE1FKX4_PETCI|nr:hypothetical protein Pcinc_019467 [Petrolisthes cinctipes]